MDVAEVASNEGAAYAQAGVYQSLRDASDRRLAAIRSAAAGYTDTARTLEALVKVPRMAVMVPVAGGLGYFTGVIDNTNAVTVLLGDNWFAERSAAQAAAVARRRVGFLGREEAAVRDEQRALEGKQALFESAMAGGDMFGTKNNSNGSMRSAQAAAAAVGATNAGPGADHRGTSGNTNDNSGPPRAVHFTDPQKAPPMETHIHGDDNNSEATGDDIHNNDDHKDIDDGEGGVGCYEEDSDAPPLIDPADELTMAELCDLEDALGDDIADEVKAEAAILALVARKKAARLGTPTATTTAEVTAPAGVAEAVAPSPQLPPAAVSQSSSSSPPPVGDRVLLHDEAMHSSQQPHGQGKQPETKKKSLFAQQTGL